MNTSTVGADQCVPGDHYGNQIRIWGGLNQLALSDADDLPAVFSADAGEEISLFDFCASIYDDVQMYIIENFPESTAAEIYLASADELLNGVETYASARGYYTYIYNPGRAGWQTVALIGPEIGEEEPEPEPVVQEYYASWEAPAQTASGSFDFSYGVRTDKIQTATLEKVDGATIEIEPITKSGSIDGGSWSISPASKQTVTTGGHTADDNYQKNGGDAGASWSLHYAVTKTSGTRNGQVGPFTTQEAADAAANSARDAAIAELQGEAQNAVNNAIAAAKAQLGSIRFRYEEITVPYGFGKYWGTNGSSQTISVPANTNNDYVIKNDEWSLQVNIKKTDSETGNQIAADAQYEIFQWDTVTGKYQPTGGYNTYSVQRQGDGSYAVINSAAYAVSDAMRHTLYYTQRNQGKFILVETKAPAGYFGDWTDIDHPGTAGTPLGKRAYYIEITEANDNVVLWLDNADYSADILAADKGGTKLVTSGGVETTVSIYNTAKNSTRVYNTDNSGKAANEDSYTVTATDGVMKNDRTLGEISISKVDLDAVRYVGGKAAHGTAFASGQAHGNATLDGAVYDLYAAEDITHPDGVTGVVDYSKIVDADGNPIWHTTIRDNSGQWVNDYLPILKKDHLVASAKIKDGWLTFANLYLGKYYVVERSTGTVIPLREGALVVSGTYPTVDSRTKAATGQVTALASSGGQYTDWVYKNQFSTISKSKALDGSWTYDAYSLSFANGYLCDEHNYYITPAYSDEGWYVEKTTFSDNRQAAGEQIDKTSYRANYHLHADNTLAESQDQVAKGNVEISKIISSSGQSNGLELENAGFTFYLVSDLSKAAQFDQTRTGAYTLQSILDAYINKSYDNAHLKWDFSGETQAIAKTYEANTAEIAAYNKTLTAAGDNKNGKGDGWQPTGTVNEYRLAEIFSNDTGNIRVQGLPYGTYLVVETTVPKDLYQAEPYLVVIDRNSPMSAMATPKDSEIVGSDSYQKFTVLDEQIEVYLRITKLDEETGKPVLLPGTAFQIYYLDDDGNYRMENGAPKLVRMTDTVNGHLTKNVTTFYTNAEGTLTLPEKLPLGKYRIVETTAPNGYYNAWAADASHYVDFTITTDRIYQATGDKNENGMDTLVIGEKYSNHETLGKLTIRKTGEVLTGWQSAPDGIDPWMTGEAENGNFTYETRPLAGAEYTITAAEDIYTQDRQLDNYGNRTLWYAKGDVVAVVMTSDGTADTAVFAPARTAATYDFLSVIHDGTIGEVSVTLPLGSYHIAETQPPYGYVGTDASFDVTLAWDNQMQEIVAADAVEFHNEREKAKVGIDSDEDAVKLAYAIVNNTKPKDAPASGGDKFWDDASVLLISALILYLIYEAPVYEQNFSTLMYMIQNCQMEEGDMGPNPLEMLFNELQERDPLHPAVLQFNSFKLGSTKTLQSVLITASANLYMFNTAQFAEMTNTDTMFLPRLGLEKRVIFCVIPDNDKTYNFLITMLYTQLFDQLFRLADSEPKFDGALPVHVRFMMDEFANVALPANFKNILAVCRSRNISCDIILQSKSQIQSLYKDDWEGMIGNCDSLIYLGGNEYATFEWLSKYIGKMTERTKSQSIGRGSRGSSSDSYQLTARDLCSPDELRRMDDGDCLVLLRSEPPVIDRKFDLMRHPNVKLTPDGGADPYRMPDDYAQTAQTISPDVVVGLTEPAITDVMYDEIQKIMEEIHDEQERNL